MEVDAQLDGVDELISQNNLAMHAKVDELAEKVQAEHEETTARMAAEAADMAAALAAAQQQLQAQMVADAMKAQVVADTHKSELEGELDAQERAASQVRAPRDMDYLPTRWS